jgi:Cys-tRNA(Pro)/Cys-tRNA(Cys) deacylase
MLNMKQMAKALGTKKCAMADKFDVEQTTGYILGRVSPLDLQKLTRASFESLTTS